MQRFRRIQQWTAVGLSALVLLLSVAASAHSVKHLNHNLTEHCTLAFHQHQFAGGLCASAPKLPVKIQRVITCEFTAAVCETPFAALYRSRAPPGYTFS